MQLINIIAIITGPIIAVIITIVYQNRKEKINTKIKLFLTLMGHRRSYPPSYDWVQALNLIDVVFANNRKVVRLWHEYYDYLHEKTDDYAKKQHKYLEMLSEMAKVLGYKNLQQTDIDKFYTPVVHGDQFDMNQKVQKELLRVLQNSAQIPVEMKRESQA